MALTGYEKPLKDYSYQELVEIAEFHTIYYRSPSGVGKISGYRRLTKDQLISIIKNDVDYKSFDPKRPRRTKRDRKPGNRFIKFKESLLGIESPEELMDQILALASDTQRPLPPIPGKHYTYIYYAATPGILYDRHPLITADKLLSRGFLAYNHHWGKYRQYNTTDRDRLVSGLYELSPQEYETLKMIPYGRIVRN